MKREQLSIIKKRKVWQTAIVVTVVSGVAGSGLVWAQQDDDAPVTSSVSHATSAAATDTSPQSSAPESTETVAPTTAPSSVSVHVNSDSADGEQSQPNVTVNGQDVDVPADGNVQKTVVSGDANTQVNINVQSNSDSSTNSYSSSSVFVNSSSSTSTN